MSSLTLKQRAAARSAARMNKTPPPPSGPDPAGVVKTSPRGKQYRIYTIPLADLPAFLEREGLIPKAYFRYAPEVTDPKKWNDGFVLGVRRNGETDEREI